MLAAGDLALGGAGADLLAPAAGRVGLALAGGLGAVALVERRRIRAIGTSTLFVRWRTWAVTAPLFGAAVMWSPWTALLFVSAVGFQAMREYAALTALPRPYRLALYAAGLASGPVALWSLTVWRAMPPILLVGATAAPLLMQDVRNGVRHLAYAALGFAYIPWLLAYFLLIREHIDGGPGLLLALGTAVAAADVLAFTAGRALGRRRLAPRISPNKTWAGVAGGVAGAALGLALMSFAMPPLAPAVRVALPVVVAGACVWGDLAESLIKRQFGAKDAGSWLPGFGGMLDRIDSLLFALPLVYTLIVVTS